ncbi:MAG: hypothetical protein WC188_03680 [Candidatus Caldatribacteriota bacterium]
MKKIEVQIDTNQGEKDELVQRVKAACDAAMLQNGFICSGTTTRYGKFMLRYKLQ